MPIAERLKYVRTYNLQTQEDIAKKLNITQETYWSWENNKRIIPLKHLNTLSNIYSLSIDYLLGLTDEMKPIKNKELDINITSNNFKTIRLENNLTTRELAKILNIGSSTVNSYEKKEYFISTHACYDLARNFNISVDWLLGKSLTKNIH